MERINRLVGTLVLVGLTVAAVAAAILALSRGRTDSYAELASRQTPLGADAREELAQRALHFTLKAYDVLSGTPRVVVVRDRTLEDLLSVDICPDPYVDPANPRYVLTVVKADLDLSNMQGVAAHAKTPEERRYGYIAYILDITGEKTMAPLTEFASRNGGDLRTILGDPTLPDDVPPDAPPGTRQVDVSVKLEECPPMEEYDAPPTPGQIAPTVPADAGP